VKNLDLECAKLGRELAELRVEDKPVDEKVFARALSVLEEQGPYACFLYLQAREGVCGEQIAEAATEFLARHFGDANDERPLDYARNLASDLDRLLFARDLLRKVLVYAHYHTKARKAGAGEGS